MPGTACYLTIIVERILSVTASTEREYLETKIAEVSENIRTLIEQAAGVSGASDDDLVQERLEEQQALYDRLIKQRDALDKAP